MKNRFRIETEELLNESHYPVKALFDMVSDIRFVQVLEGITNGIGFGENYGACVFWNELDDYDKQHLEKYEGAEFGLHSGEEIIIGYRDLLYYLNIICRGYCDDFPEEKERVNKLLGNYKLKYEVS